MTDQQFTDWLSNPNSTYTFLIEAQALVGGAETIFYMSTDGFRTSPTDTPPNTVYDAVATLGVLFTEQLSLDSGDASISQGSLDILNLNGERDAWRTYVWANRPLKIFIGDARWSRADFRMVFSGITADLKPNGRTKLSIKLRDKLQLLNTTMTETKLGGTTQNKDSIIPIALGECHNVSPLQEDPVQLTFRVSQADMEAIKEVRDNAIPLIGTSLPIFDTANGRFQLVAEPAGTITCTVQGEKMGGTYYNTCAKLIQYVVTTYGNATTRFTNADIDTANFNSFDSSNQQPMGRYVSDRDNVLTVCRDLAGSLGAQISISVTTGLLRIIQVGTPISTPITVTAADMEERSLEPDNSPDVIAAVKLGFCKNWTVQDPGTLNGIPQEHKDLYGEEWLTTTEVDGTVQANYKLSGDPTEIDTMLLRRADADPEALRRLNYWKVPRTVYYFNGYPWLFMTELGAAINVTYHRYGMQNGVTGMIVSIARDWQKRRVKIGFIV